MTHRRNLLARWRDWRNARRVTRETRAAALDGGYRMSAPAWDRAGRRASEISVAPSAVDPLH